MKHLNPILYFIVTFGIVAGINALAWPPESILIKRNPRINPQYKNVIDHKKPDVVLLGNSILGEAIDEQVFERESGWRTVKISAGGGATAWWYIIMKNQIGEAEHKPRYVVLFFRDQYLTIPDFRVTENYGKRIDEFAGPDEPVLDRLAYLSKMTSQEYLMKRYWPLFQKRGSIMERFENSIKSLVADIFIKKNAGVQKVDDAIIRVFDDKNLNQELLTIQQIMAETVKTSHTFRESIDNSFLPHMLKIADDNDIQMIFVRMKRQRDLWEKEPGKLVKYFNEMRLYLESHGAALIDYTDDKRIVKKHFGAGDHLNRDEGRTLFTQIIIEDLKPYIDTGSQ